MNYDNDFVNIAIEDDASKIQFLEVQVKLADFARALTGQGFIPMEFQQRGLPYVGMRKEVKPLVFGVPDFYDSKGYAEKACHNYVEDGWIANDYFGSQDSIRKGEDGRYYAHGTQYRYTYAEEK
jgi:hypothetical protein